MLNGNERGKIMKHIKDLQPVTDRTLEARLASLERAWKQREERKPKEQPEKPKAAERLSCTYQDLI